VSLEALTWALYDVHLSGPEVPQSQAVDALAKLVLIALADQASRDGTGARASRAYLSEVTGLGQTTVGDRMRRLRRAGLVRPGDAELVAGERYPVAVWDLAMPTRPLRPRRGVRGRGSPPDPLGKAEGVGRRPPRPRSGEPARGGREGVARGSRGGRAGDDTPGHTLVHPDAPGAGAGQLGPAPAPAGGPLVPSSAVPEVAEARRRMRTRRRERAG
jgi:hypothetical protein